MDTHFTSQPYDLPEPIAFYRVRLLTEDDIPFLLDLGKRRYAVEYDLQCTEAWFRNVVLTSPLIFCALRTDHAFTICNLVKDAWLPGVTICNNMMLNSEAGAVWEEIALMRAAIEWARKRRCTQYRIWSDTAIDLRAVALRVGAYASACRYSVTL